MPLCALFSFGSSLRRILPVAVLAAGAVGGVGAEPAPLPPRVPLVLAPNVEDMRLCDEGVRQPQLLRVEEVYAYCAQRKLDGSAALNRLLDTLEPGGAKGQVQVGYTATVQLLRLYKQTPSGWALDEAQIDALVRFIRRVPRPVVVYLAADHFDTLGPLTDELVKDPRNLMQLRDGTPPISSYFGYRIVPYTLLADRSIPVNRYRFDALQALARRFARLPADVRQRIVAFTLAGELHHLFPNFEGGMGAYQDIRTTDYSAQSVAGFRQWLAGTHKDIASLNAATGLHYASFEAVPAPSRDIRKEPLSSYGEHYDAFADGTLPLAGWLWDAQQRIKRLELYVDGARVGEVPHGMNRLDVYRAVEAVPTPSVGFRYDLDFSQMPPGRHLAQIAALDGNGRLHQAHEVEFVVMGRDQKAPAPLPARARQSPVSQAPRLAGLRSALDLPRPLQDVYFNPLARLWNRYREHQVHTFLRTFHQTALDAGLPADKLYSHQIVPRANPTWNPQLFAADTTLLAGTPWRAGLNMYGGSANSAWMHGFVAQQGLQGYGVPEFNPQQWKRKDVHLEALHAHYRANARFVSPYYFSVIPDRFKGGEHGVNRMEIRPDNTKDGSDAFYRALVEFARH